ncbi:DUF5949 family protein [Streptomyces sp. HNM0574]|uniref:DUF5949 family protein n=1 Tax=Streptomyces sp. HNM0574 TaxID=2714954 RepID=UPI00146EDAC3|nr:DUF5949 family protein [Streptomyces sp. HNM0574]NLU71062.1 hypothetical protein [Streptomyces sp. HNM0574]
MTSIQSGVRGFQQDRFGTFMLLGWTGTHAEDGQESAFLLAYSLGDGTEGLQGIEEAARALAEESGLTVGGFVPETGTRRAMKLVVESGQAVLTMPHVSAQYTARDEWLRAAQERGCVNFILATRPWPVATPGRPVTEDELRAFVGDEEMLRGAAHGVLTVGRVQS